MPREFVDPGADQVGELKEQSPALDRVEPPPRAMKRPLSRLDRGVDVGRLPPRDFANFNPARRILDRQALARLGRDPASVDETFVGFEPSQLGGGKTSLAASI